ncbi:hypothetical protein DFS33DRAFT_881419 [Desarmillaria ectypa]|nr:hypothetical protein DFS33DRAFT_881419 [Desarmillaria ectypa]
MVTSKRPKFHILSALKACMRVSSSRPRNTLYCKACMLQTCPVTFLTLYIRKGRVGTVRLLRDHMYVMRGISVVHRLLVATIANITGYTAFSILDLAKRPHHHRRQHKNDIPSLRTCLLSAGCFCRMLRRSSSGRFLSLREETPEIYSFYQPPPSSFASNSL